MMARRWLVGACAATLLLRIGHARANTSSEVLAEELFREGKRLMGEGRFAEACPKLAESLNLDPGGGTLLALGLCHEGEGRTASAWAELKDALSVARREGRKDRIEVIDARLAALEPRLARVRVKVPAAVAKDPSLAIRVDGLEYPRAAWGIGVAVDPGRHVVEATAAKHVPLRLDVNVPDEPRTTDVEIGELAEEVPIVELPAAPKAPSPSARPSPIFHAPQPKGRSHWVFPASMLTGGVGLGVLGAGIGFAVHASALSADADRTCPSATCTSRDAVDTSVTAGTFADVATVSFAVSGALVATALVLYLVSHGERGPQISASSPVVVRF